MWNSVNRNNSRSLCSSMRWVLLFLGCCCILGVSSGVIALTAAPGGGVVVVTGATGNVGSRLVKQLVRSSKDEPHENVKVVALVRNATKARSMLVLNNNDDEDRNSNIQNNNGILEIIEADFEDPQSLESAFRSAASCDSKSDSNNPDDKACCLFLACGNVPNQREIELNVARAAAAAATTPSSMFCVKLSTATPLMENPRVSHAQIHSDIEAELPRLFPDQKYAILRPNVFSQMLTGSLFGIDANGPAKKAMQHLLASNPELAFVDCEDVAACAGAILGSVLDNGNNNNIHGGKVYELTGPKPLHNSWTEEFWAAANKFRVVPLPDIVGYDSVRAGPEAMGMPPEAVDRMEAFLSSLLSYTTATDTVEKLLGRPPRSLTDFVLENPTPFLPTTFQRLLARGKADSFRQAAKSHTLSMEDELDQLQEDEVLVRVQSAGVNGGANTFSVTNAPKEDKDFPLGAEATGIVVAVGSKNASTSKNEKKLRPGDTVVFIARGSYGEYVRANARFCTRVSDDLLEAKREVRDLPGELAALRISGLTALVALGRTAPIREGDTVLVTACCGGTGHFAVQIAKNAGATVIGTVGSTAKVAVAESLGCIDRVVDLSQESLSEVLQTEYPGGIDICYEGVGGKLLKTVHDHMAEGGRILVVGSISQYPHNAHKESHNIPSVPEDIMKEVFGAGPGRGTTLTLANNVRLIGNVWGDAFTSGELGDYNEKLYQLYQNGKIRALVDPEHEFVGVDSICDAVDHMLSRKSVGKVTATISGH